MPGATIVYNGGGGGGDLFVGMRFYMLQRVPSRDKWKDLVTANGGAVVLAEAQANIVIADHARNNQPIGSISWTFIDQSVKNGRLEDVEDHRAGAATNVVREVGSTQPARQGRIPFTAEDDKFLMDWCTKAERRGISVKGNVLFKQLEEMNARHTYQSWRDRWVKKLIHMPRPDLDDVEVEEEEEEGQEVEEQVEELETLPRPVRRKEPPQNIPARSKNAAVVSRATQQIKKESPKSVSTSRPSVQGSASRGTDTARKATDVQDDIPRSAHTKSSGPPIESPSPERRSSPPIIEPNGDVFSEEDTQKLVELHSDILTVQRSQMIDFWVLWSKEYPEHTAQEWFNHFEEYVDPMMKSRSKKGKSKDIPPPAPKASTSKLTPQAVPQRTIEIKDSQDQPFDQVTTNASSQKLVAIYLADEVAFTDDLLNLAGHHNLDVKLNTLLSGRAISMFSLWVVVNEFGGFQNVVDNNLWPKVAIRLDFDLKRWPEAPNELEAYFQEYEDLLIQFDTVARDEEDEEAEEEPDRHDSSLLADQLLDMVGHNTDPVEREEDEEVNQHEELEEDGIDSSQLSLNQRQLNSKKRISFGSSPFTKRQRLDKGKGKELEIPSTPEDAKSHPTLRHTLEPSPLKNASFSEGEESGEEYLDEEDELFVPANGQIPSSERPRNVEPETQDFYFPVSSSPQDKFSSPRMSSSPPARLKQIHQSQTSNAATRGSAHSTNVEDSSTQSETQSQINALIDKCVADLVDKGFPHEIVIQALQATTLKLGPEVEQVAEKLNNEESIPENIRGVWTTRDDEDLERAVDSKQYRHVLLKHGPEEIRERKRYLRELAAA